MAGVKISQLNPTFELNDTDTLPLARPGVGNGTTHKIYGSVFGKAADVTDLQNNKVTKNNAIVGATKTKITYDTKGLVTAGSDLAASDLPSHVIATNTGLGSQHTISGATAGQVLRATGATTAAFQAIQASDLPSNIDATKIANGSVNNTEFQCLSSVTSDIQAQINALNATVGSLGKTWADFKCS